MMTPNRLKALCNVVDGNSGVLTIKEITWLLSHGYARRSRQKLWGYIATDRGRALVQSIRALVNGGGLW